MKLWRDNRIDQEYELTDAELEARFIAFELKRDQPFPRFEREVACFLTMKAEEGGLQSVVEVEDQRRLEELLYQDEFAKAAWLEAISR